MYRKKNSEKFQLDFQNLPLELRGNLFLPTGKVHSSPIRSNEIINFTNSDFCKLLRLPISPILKTQ